MQVYSTGFLPGSNAIERLVKYTYKHITRAYHRRGSRSTTIRVPAPPTIYMFSVASFAQRVGLPLPRPQ